MQKDLLVIEDTQVHLSMLRKIAAQAGFATSGVDSVAGATLVLEKRTFACITLDLNLGEQSGTEVLQLLADLKCRTPVVIISAEDDCKRDVTVRAAKILGLNVVPPISKPVDLAALRQTLKQIADESERQRIIRLSTDRHRIAR